MIKSIRIALFTAVFAALIYTSVIFYFSLPLVFIDHWSGECLKIEDKGIARDCDPVPDEFIIVHVTRVVN